MSDDIRPLYEVFQKIPFPNDARSRVVGGFDLIAADYTASGCVEVYLDRGGLDSWRLAVLGLCYGGLQRIVAETSGDVRDYFAKLEVMAEMVLKAIRDSGSPTP